MSNILHKYDSFKEKFSMTIIYIFLILYSMLSLVPFVWSIISSLKDNDDILIHPLALPKIWKINNYPQAWTEALFKIYTVNTALYSIISTAAILLFSAMAAYIIARIKPNLTLYMYFTFGIMIPIHTILLPTFLMLRALHLFNTRLGLILVYIAFNLSISIFILVGFMKGLPKELEEAALIDGCSRVRTFFEIIFPLSKPGLATIGILAFLNTWNEFLIPLIMIQERYLRVITQGIRDLREQYGQDYGLVNAGIVISFIPVVIIYILFQEQVIAGMTAGAIKG